MYSKTYGAATFGIEGMIITAMKNTGIFLKQQKITLNLATADLRI